MTEIIDPVFAKTSPKCSFSMTENERFGLVFANRVYKFGHRNRFPAWRAGTTKATQAGGIESAELIPGLHKRLKIRAPI